MRMRQRLEGWQNRPDTRSSWFRVGVLSATVLAPLIARWNNLRTSRNAQSLRELAGARLDDARNARDQAAARRTQMRAAATARLDDVLALASAKLDDARVLTNAKLDVVRTAARPHVDEVLDRLVQVRTPEVLKNVLPFSLVAKRAEELERGRQRRQRQTTMLWLAGVGVGMVAPGAIAFELVRRRMSAHFAEDVDESKLKLPALNEAEVRVHV
jgi:hypothetical protein